MTAAAFTKNDRTLYTGSTDGTVIGWDTANLNDLGAQLSPPGRGVIDGQVRWMTASLTGDVAMGYPNGNVRFWPSDNLSPTPPIHVSDQALTAGAFSPDGHLFATSDRHGTARLVDVRSQRVIATVAHLSAPAKASPSARTGGRLSGLTPAGRSTTSTRRPDGSPGRAAVDGGGDRRRGGR